jgi:tetraacyldisaccharide-1-P 4'-kinase
LLRDLDIVCLGPGDAEDCPMPAGRLREFSGALERAQLRVSVVGAGEAASGADFVARRRAHGCEQIDGTPAELPRRPLLVSGVARPERFAADVRGLGCEVIGHRALRDHHRFAAREVEALGREALARGADALLTTAKDAVRWPGVATAVPTRVLKIALDVDRAEALLERVLSVARRAV